MTNAKYFKIATAQTRPLQYKNCYDWVMVKYDEVSGLCFYRIGNKLNVSSIAEVLAIHKMVTRQKPYSIKSVQVAEFWGKELAIIDYASEHLTQSQIIDKSIEDASLSYLKNWQGHILKNVNELTFLKSIVK